MAVGKVLQTSSSRSAVNKKDYNNICKMVTHVNIVILQKLVSCVNKDFNFYAPPDLLSYFHDHLPFPSIPDPGETSKFDLL